MASKPGKTKTIRGMTPGERMNLEAKIRELYWNDCLPVMTIAKRLHISRAYVYETLNKFRDDGVLDETFDPDLQFPGFEGEGLIRPWSREATLVWCPSCGARVQPPCLVCWLKARDGLLDRPVERHDLSGDLSVCLEENEQSRYYDFHHRSRFCLSSSIDNIEVASESVFS